MTDESTKFFGLIRRAGKLEVGDMAVTSALQNHKVKAVLMASDSGGNTKKRIESISSDAHVPVVVTPWEKSLFSHSIGRDNVAVVGITDLGFAAAMMQKLSEEYPDRQEYTQKYTELSEKQKLISSRKNDRRK